MQKIKYNILFAFLLLCLLFHLAFSPLNIIKDKALDGYYKVPEKVELNLSNYFSRKFQDSLDKGINYQFGLSPGFTRIHHQIEYSCFDHIFVRDVYKGKNGYLFRYCPGCISDNEFDAAYINNFANRFLKIQDSLKAAGKNIVWIIAPDKNMVYPEFLPDNAPKTKSINGYYWSLKKVFAEKKINVIDFNELAAKEKEKYPFPVFYKGGVHWSHSYAARCFDSICRYLSTTTAISIQNTFKDRVTEHPWSPDIDMEYAANLLAPIKDAFYYTSVISKSNAKNKKILIVGDSFCHAWMWNKWYQECFDAGSEFWYYNREVNAMDNSFKRKVDHKNAKKEISKFDTFIVVFSAGNAEYLDYGFTDDLSN
ncbi:MAG: alginate O-acetyltransferase AlgX-related protein [Bacteroidia bacterium]